MTTACMPTTPARGTRSLLSTVPETGRGQASLWTAAAAPDHRLWTTLRGPLDPSRLPTCPLPRRRRRGRGQVGKLEGSNGPRRVVQSLWSGAAAAVHRLACPRPVSSGPESNDRVPVAGVVGLHAVIITMRRSPAGGQPQPPARRSVDMVLRDLHADKRLHNRHSAVVPGSAPHILD